MYLRKICRQDTELLVDWRNLNADFFPPRPTELTIYQHIEWYEVQYARNPADHMYLIEAEGPDYYGPVGTIGINLTDDTIQRVMRGVLGVAPGIMAEALKRIMAVYDRECYHLQVLRTNQHAIAFYLANGFDFSLSPDPSFYRMHCYWQDME